MRKTIATLGVVGLGLMSAAVTANAAPPEEKKITICHATNAAGNPFVVETINLSALKAHADDTRDIVPANDGDIYPNGQNLTAANLALLANNCVAVVPPVDTDPVDKTPDPVDETPDPVDETPEPEDETPGADATPVSANTPAPAVLAPKAAVPAAKPAASVAPKTNAGYNVQTAVGRSADTGVPVWLMALTGVFTAGAATAVWQGGRRARSTESQ